MSQAKAAAGGSQCAAANRPARVHASDSPVAQLRQERHVYRTCAPNITQAPSGAAFSQSRWVLAAIRIRRQTAARLWRFARFPPLARPSESSFAAQTTEAPTADCSHPAPEPPAGLAGESPASLRRDYGGMRGRGRHFTHSAEHSAQPMRDAELTVFAGLAKTPSWSICAASALGPRSGPSANPVQSRRVPEEGRATL